MSGRQPRDTDAVIRRLRASLDERAGDFIVTPAFGQRVRALRRRRFTWGVAQAVVATAVLAALAVVALDAFRTPDRVEFTRRPAVVPSVTETTPSPTPDPDPTPSPTSDPEPARDPEPAPSQAPPPREPPPDVRQDEPLSTPAPEPAPVPTRLFLDGTGSPGSVCRETRTRLVASLDHPESETAYILDLRDPVTMTIIGEGVSDVSDTVAVEADGPTTTYIATFETDNDSFGVTQVRLVGPTDPDPC